MKRTSFWTALAIVAYCGAWLGIDAASGVAQETAVAAEPIPFSAQATAIPFPPDARQLEFSAPFDGIEFQSRSSLAALADFYRRELTRRGWEEDVSAAEIEDDSVELLFQHGDAEVELDLSGGSDGEVDVDMSCEELDFAGTNDPAALLAAGVPQPRSYLYLQRAIQRPEDAIDVEYGDDECRFKTKLGLQAAFDHFSAMIKQLGYRESRQPIVTGDRRYTEFRSGPVELSLNIFTHEYGTRLLIGYEDERQEPTVAPLPEPAMMLAGGRRMDGVGGAAGDGTSPADVETAPRGQPVEVANNKGEAVVTHGSTTYAFRHVAAYQTNQYDNERTVLLFTNRPLPLQKVQALLADNEDFSFGDLFDLDLPQYLMIELGEYASMSFSAPGLGMSHSLENLKQDVKIENGRVRATLNMPSEEILDEQFGFTATADAGLMTRHTRLANFTDPPAAASLKEADLPLPPGARDTFNQASNYRRETHATVDMPLADLAAFYRGQYAAPDWTEDEQAGLWDADNAAKPRGRLIFTKPEESIAVDLSGGAQGVEVVVASRDDAKARRDGVLPEPGKGRLMMANSHTKSAVIAIRKQNYPLKPGQGADGPKSTLNYTVAPGTYPLKVTVAGEPPEEEAVQIDAGTAWIVIVGPTGGYLAFQIY